MFSSVIGVIGLCCACGLSAIDLSTPRVKEAMYFDNGYVSANQTNYSDNSILENGWSFMYGSLSNSSINITSNYSTYNANAFGNYLSNIGDYKQTITPYYFANANYDFVVVSNCKVGQWVTRPGGTRRQTITLQFTSAVSKDYIRSISNTGMFLGIDIYFNEMYFNEQFLSFSVKSVTNSYFDITNNIDMFLNPIDDGLSADGTYLYDEYFIDYRDNVPGENVAWYDSSAIMSFPGYNENVEYVNFGFVMPFYDSTSRGGVGTISNDDFLYWNHLVYEVNYYNYETDLNGFPYDTDCFTSVLSLPFVNESNASYQVGYNDGWLDGYGSGQTDLGNANYQEGYEAGYNAGLQNGGTTWKGLFGAVADTPILMLRSMFNFDLFGMNVLSVVLSLTIALVVLRIVIKIIF